MRSHCTYCGRGTDRAIACVAHADLPKIDPFFSPDVPQRNEPAERSLTEACSTGSLPAGG